MVEYYEIHCYQEDAFQYVVARTNKWSEEKVKSDVQRMNSMLSSELKVKGMRYVFAQAVERHGQAGNKWSKNEHRKTSDPEYSP
jgi:hypothetical protein